MTKKEFLDLIKDMPDDAELIAEGDDVLYYAFKKVEYKENVEDVVSDYVYNKKTVSKAIILS